MTRGRAVQVGLVLLLPLLLVVGLAMASMVWAGSAGGIAVDWSVLSGGGAPAASSAGGVTLNGSLGQTGIGSSSGTGATVGAGFWYGLGEDVYEVYLPVTLRNH
jgi:uncharacterized membrane protein (Fun14 family)